MSSKEKNPVKPYKNTIPNKIKLDEKEPSMKYFKPASIEYKCLLLKAAKTYSPILNISNKINKIKKLIAFNKRIQIRKQFIVIKINSKLFIVLQLL